MSESIDLTGAQFEPSELVHFNPQMLFVDGFGRMIEYEKAMVVPSESVHALACEMYRLKASPHINEAKVYVGQVVHGK